MDKLEKVLKKAKEDFTESYSADRENRELAKEDLKFAYDEDGQWDDSLRSKRAGLPCYTFNKIAGALDQVLGDQRQNRPSIKVLPVGDGADEKLANTYSGIIKNVETQSSADQAYDSAFLPAIAGGIGAFRVLTEYANESAFEQNLVIKPIHNPYMVYFDPYAKNYSKDDGRYMLLVTPMAKDQFEKIYPEADAKSWDCGQEDEWEGKDSIYVAEYWYKEKKTKELLLLSDGRTIDAEKAEDIIDELKSAGITIKKRRKAKCDVIMTCTIAGNSFVEEPYEWPGKYFPICLVFGKETYIDGKYKYRGLVRFAKDAQRTYNLHRSVAIERVALAPKAPILATNKMVDGHETQWNNANTKPYPYLLYNNDPEVPGGRPFREPTPQVPSADMGLAQMDADDIKSATGIYDASLGQRSNETSGRAIMARQREGDTATFTYIDNLARSIKYCGKILVDLIPKIYDTERQVRLLKNDGTSEVTLVNQEIKDIATGKDVKLNDLSVGSFDVEVVVGPSYNTQRMEAAESMIEFMRQMPQAANLVADLMVDAMDWPKKDVIAERLKLLLPPEAREGEAMQIPPQLQAQMQQVQGQMEQMAQVIQQGGEQMKSLEAENAQLKLAVQNKTGELALKAKEVQIKEVELAIKGKELGIKEQETQIKSLEAQADIAAQAKELEIKEAELVMKAHESAISNEIACCEIDNKNNESQSAMALVTEAMTPMIQAGQQLNEMAQSIANNVSAINRPKTKIAQIRKDEKGKPYLHIEEVKND